MEEAMVLEILELERFKEQVHHQQNLNEEQQITLENSKEDMRELLKKIKDENALTEAATKATTEERDLLAQERNQLEREKELLAYKDLESEALSNKLAAEALKDLAYKQDLITNKERQLETLSVSLTAKALKLEEQSNHQKEARAAIKKQKEQIEAEAIALEKDKSDLTEKMRSLAEKYDHLVEKHESIERDQEQREIDLTNIKLTPVSLKPHLTDSNKHWVC